MLCCAPGCAWESQELQGLPGLLLSLEQVSRKILRVRASLETPVPASSSWAASSRAPLCPLPEALGTEAERSPQPQRHQGCSLSLSREWKEVDKGDRRTPSLSQSLAQAQTLPEPEEDPKGVEF